VAEEIFFRGLIYGYLRRWGFWPALALSTLIFTLLHTGAAGILLPQIVGGLVFAAAYEIEKAARPHHHSSSATSRSSAGVFVEVQRGGSSENMIGAALL
jgi:hypothetical protein